MRIFFTLLLCGFFGFYSYSQTDAKVEAVYTLAKIPAPLGVYKHIVQARIINKGTIMLSSLPVSLQVTGANSYSNIQFADIAPGDTALVSFSSFSPWNQGTNTITVSVPSDDNNLNNSAAYTQVINSDTYSYADDSAPVSSIGYGNNDGMLLTRYNVSGSGVVKKVKVYISNETANIGNTVYGVVVNFGMILGQSAAHVITAADLNAYLTLDIINPPDVDFDFYAGLLQTANSTTAYYPVAFQNEGVPTRPDAYYGSQANGSGLTSFNYFGRLMIQAVVGIGSVTPFNSSASTANNVIAGWDFSGVNSPVSFAATTYDTLLSSFNALTRSAAVPASTGIHSFRSTGFQSNSIAATNTDYFQITLSPKAGDTLSLNSISGYVHANSTNISSAPVKSQFAYSTDGINFTLIGSAFNTNTNVKNFTVSLAAVAALQNIVNGTTITLRYFASGVTAASGWGFVSLEPGYNGLAVYGRLVTSNSILTSPVVPTGAPYTLPDCNTTSTGSVSFSASGNFCPDNKYIVQLGEMDQPHFNVFRFKNPVNIGLLESGANSGVINFTIPAGVSEFNPYAIRIISTKPYVAGSFTQPFVINTLYCHSQPADKFRSRISGNWNDIGSWESSNGNTWIAATLVPDENASEIEIVQGTTINIISNIVLTNTIVRGNLKLINDNTNKGLISFISPGLSNNASMKIDTNAVFQVLSSGSTYNDAVYFIGGSVKIAGKIVIGDGLASIAAGFDGFATDMSGVISWQAGSVFEWNSTVGNGPVANTYFPDGAEAPTLRLTNIPGGIMGNDDNTMINGLLEVNTPVTWTGAGTKTFRDGIKGNASITQATGSGAFFMTSSYEEIAGTSNTIPALKGILAGTLTANLSSNGFTLVGGAGIIDSAKINLSGPCSSLQTLGLTRGATLQLNNGSMLTLENADLSNAGLINGSGNIEFNGDMLSTLSSPGTINAPISIVNKQLQLGATSNISALSLSAESNLMLEKYNLNMGAATLTADSANFIVTNDTGRLNRYVGNMDMLYPIGINNESYTPVTIKNAGNADNIKARVAAGIQTTAPLTNGNVDRTWFIADTSQTGIDLTISTRWNSIDEQASFDRNSCYISHYTNCPAPLNCATGFYDATAAGVASGTNAFTIQRSSITNFRSPAFIVSSRPFVFTFTGNGDWNNAANWTPPSIAPAVIPTGVEVIIDPVVAGECLFNGDIILQNGGKLSVRTGKQFRITGNLIVQ